MEHDELNTKKKQMNPDAHVKDEHEHELKGLDN